MEATPSPLRPTGPTSFLTETLVPPVTYALGHHGPSRTASSVGTAASPVWISPSSELMHSNRSSSPISAPTLGFDVHLLVSFLPLCACGALSTSGRAERSRPGSLTRSLYPEGPCVDKNLLPLCRFLSLHIKCERLAGTFPAPYHSGIGPLPRLHACAATCTCVTFIPSAPAHRFPRQVTRPLRHVLSFRHRVAVSLTLCLPLPPRHCPSGDCVPVSS